MIYFLITYLAIIHWQGLAITLTVIMNLATTTSSIEYVEPEYRFIVGLISFVILNTLSMYYLNFLNGLVT